jgi:putative ABC transport system permease protein
MREFATFKAIGFGPRFVFGVGLIETAILAMGAYIPAIVLGSGLLYAVEHTTHLPTVVTVALAARVLFVVLAMCLLAAIAVAYRIARADPVDLYSV